MMLQAGFAYHHSSPMMCNHDVIKASEDRVVHNDACFILIGNLLPYNIRWNLRVKQSGKIFGSGNAIWIIIGIVVGPVVIL